MRIWSLHPKHLDAKGLVALWRETLLAQKVLQGRTKGYTNHPQLERFKNTDSPLNAISTYLYHTFQEAKKRGYKFDSSKIVGNTNYNEQIIVSKGQVEYELKLLKSKLSQRDPKMYKKICNQKIVVHPIFKKNRSNKIEKWEVVRGELL